MKFRSSFAIALTLAFTTSAFAAQAPSSDNAKHPPGAAIASGHALATEAGFEMLRAGGNAFDAAVAVSAALSVVEPISSGIGGGGFFLLHDASTGKDVFIDAREIAPTAATPAAFLDAKGDLDRNRAENGPWSAGIPGLPAGLVHVSQNYGKLPLSTTLAPAIRLARNGFPIYARLERGYGFRREVMERYRRHARRIPGRRRCAQGGRNPQATGSGAHAGTAGGERLRRFLPRRCRQETAEEREGRRRAMDGERTGRLPHRRTRAAALQLPRPAHHHRAAAVFGRRGHGADLQHPLRLGSVHARRRAAHPPVGRVDAPRLSRPHDLHGRSRLRHHSAGAPDQSRLCRRPACRHPSRQGHAEQLAARRACTAGRRRNHPLLHHRRARQPRVHHADGQPALRFGPDRARHRRAAQQRDG